ncbi:MAG: DEAD/DEAH box helicase family protein, partial [Saprospiraceae bacterium]
MVTLRPYQQTAVEKIRQAYVSGCKAPLLVLPTGGGKTVVFSHIAATSSARGKRVLILVHRIELLRQTAKALQRAGIQPGLINPAYTPNYRAPVQVAMVQTMAKRTHYFRKMPFDLIITDECHHVVSKTYRDILAEFPNAYQLGVTATPVRGDGLGLGIIAGGVYDTLIMGPTVAELIAGGYLVKPAIYVPKDRVDLTGIRTRMGDYDKAELETRMDKPQITGNAVEHYRRTLDGLPAVAFCVSVQHAQHVAAEFQRAGIQPGLINPAYAPNYRAPVQVAMVQTMAKRTHFFRKMPFDLIITDECHHVVSKTYRDILAEFPNAYQLGVTATPVRGDGLGLGVDAGGVYDTLIMGPTVSELIAGGYLVKPAIYVPKDRVDLTGIRTRMGDFDKAELANRMDKPQITGNAVEHYRRALDGLPAVAFCVSVQHAQ